MKPTQPPDEMKQLFLATPVPQIDIKDQVMEKLHERNRHKEAYRVKRKVALIVAASLVFGVTSAFAAIKVYELKNDKGEAIFKINETAQEQVIEYKSYDEKLNEIREGLKPGSAVAVYIASNDNPEKMVSVLHTPITSTDRSVIQTEVGKLFAFPAELVGGYSFKNGFVERRVHYDYDEKAMIEEAERTKKDVIVKNLKVDPIVNRTGATYSGSAGEVLISVDNLENTKWISTDASPDETVEKITVGGKEALYHVKKNEQKEIVWKYIVFLKEDANLLLEVKTRSAQVTKEDLLAIAEQFK